MYGIYILRLGVSENIFIPYHMCYIQLGLNLLSIWRLSSSTLQPPVSSVAFEKSKEATLIPKSLYMISPLPSLPF